MLDLACQVLNLDDAEHGEHPPGLAWVANPGGGVGPQGTFGDCCGAHKPGTTRSLNCSSSAPLIVACHIVTWPHCHMAAWPDRQSSIDSHEPTGVHGNNGCGSPSRVLRPCQHRRSTRTMEIEGRIQRPGSTTGPCASVVPVCIGRWRGFQRIRSESPPTRRDSGKAVDACTSPVGLEVYPTEHGLTGRLRSNPTHFPVTER